MLIFFILLKFIDKYNTIYNINKQRTKIKGTDKIQRYKLYLVCSPNAHTQFWYQSSLWTKVILCICANCAWALFLFIFGGAYLRREICISKLIGLACSEKEIYHFCYVLPCIRWQILSTSSPGGLYSEGRFNGGCFLRYDFGGLIFGGAYTRRGLFSEFYGICI